MQSGDFGDHQRRRVRASLARDTRAAGGEDALRDTDLHRGMYGTCQYTGSASVCGRGRVLDEGARVLGDCSTSLIKYEFLEGYACRPASEGGDGGKVLSRAPAPTAS